MTSRTFRPTPATSRSAFPTVHWTCGRCAANRDDAAFVIGGFGLLLCRQCAAGYVLETHGVNGTVETVGDLGTIRPHIRYPHSVDHAARRAS